MNTCFRLSCLCLSLVATPVVAAERDNNPATDSLPRAIPYEGRLSVDGVPLNGDVSVTFTLWSSSAGDDALYSETRVVHFVRGDFSVLLGASAPGNDQRVPDAVFDGDDLYLGIALGNTVLPGRQRIVPVAHALWAARAADFDVAGALNVRGGGTFGDLSVNQLMPLGGEIAAIDQFTPSRYRAENGQRVPMTAVSSSLCFLVQTEAMVQVPVPMEIAVGLQVLVPSTAPVVCAIDPEAGSWVLAAGGPSSCSAQCISFL